jgi:hypothetical protein
VDLHLAVELEQQLNLVVSIEFEDVPKSLVDFRNSLAKLISNAVDLNNSLDALHLIEKKPSLVNTRDIVSSPTKSEVIATIEPSVFEEFHLNEELNATISESKPVFNNGVQVCVGIFKHLYVLLAASGQDQSIQRSWILAAVANESCSVATRAFEASNVEWICWTAVCTAASTD